MAGLAWLGLAAMVHGPFGLDSMLCLSLLLCTKWIESVRAWRGTEDGLCDGGWTSHRLRG